MLRSSGRPMMARSEAGFNKEKPAGSSGGLSSCAGNRFSQLHNSSCIV
jgi:hypothetical protein